MATFTRGSSIWSRLRMGGPPAVQQVLSTSSTAYNPNRNCFHWGFSIMSLPRTLGELRQSPFSEQRLSTRRVKDEMRDNLIVKLRQGGPIFPGIVGYDDTVVPQIARLASRTLLVVPHIALVPQMALRSFTPETPQMARCLAASGTGTDMLPMKSQSALGIFEPNVDASTASMKSRHRQT